MCICLYVHVHIHICTYTRFIALATETWEQWQPTHNEYNCKLLVSKYQFPLKGTKIRVISKYESGNLQDEPETSYCARKNVYKKSWDMSKGHSNQCERALISQIWNKLNIKIIDYNPLNIKEIYVSRDIINRWINK